MWILWTLKLDFKWSEKQDQSKYVQMSYAMLVEIQLWED
mgnify:CR=1 FL=1